MTDLQKPGLLKRLFGGSPDSPPPTSTAIPTGEPEGDASPLGSRLGHQPVLHEMLARQILDAHLRNRHQLHDHAPADLATASPDEARLLVRAMAAAAHANGKLDGMELGRIRGKLRSSPLDEEEQRALEGSLEEPQCLEELVRQVDSPRLAARFYAVSLAAVDKNAPINRSYLRYLAQRLGLPADLVVRLNRQMGLRL
ncbi:MAG: DUF533 domain-containing protein [Alphaproteobacteria bacterium]